ncbi:PIN domain-containing protein [Tunicatimonas pelagia]|uniref:PIN domain-containing protein n=1 Tax=Tunicatimonas pelagia TaxID=931531 RepID=UPI00345CC189
MYIPEVAPSLGVADLLSRTFQLCVTTDILNEYTEIIERHMGAELADATLRVIVNLPTTLRIETYYKWNLIKDADDNKFVDCALAANARFIVSHDKHFDILKRIDFPKVYPYGELDSDGA